MMSLQKEKQQILSVDDTEIGGMPLDMEGYLQTWRDASRHGGMFKIAGNTRRHFFFSRLCI